MSTRRRITVALGSCAVALAAVTPSAGAAWTPQQELPDSAGSSPLLATFGAGTAPSVVVHGPPMLIPFTAPGSPQVPLAIARMTAGGAFGAPTPLPGGLSAPVATSPNGTLLAVGGPRGSLDYFGLERRRARLRAGIGPVDGSLDRIAMPKIIATQTLASAVNDRGDAAVVFSRCVTTSCAKRSVLATFRRRGRGFAAPVVLAHRTGYPVASVAVNAHGDALVAWIQHRAHARGNDIRTRVRHANGMLTKMRIAGPTAPVPAIAVTLSNGRHGVVSWFSEAVGEGSLGGPVTVSAADMDSRGALSSRYVLDRGTPSGHGESDAVRGARLRAILGQDDVTTLAWTGFAGGHYVVRAARVARRVATTESLSPTTLDAQLTDLSTDGAGDVLAVWESVPGQARAVGVGAVIRPAGATTFGAPQLVLTGVDAAAEAVGAIAPGGRAIVAAGPGQLSNNNLTGVRVTRLLG